MTKKGLYPKQMQLTGFMIFTIISIFLFQPGISHATQGDVFGIGVVYNAATYKNHPSYFGHSDEFNVVDLNVGIGSYDCEMALYAPESGGVVTKRYINDPGWGNAISWKKGSEEIFLSHLSQFGATDSVTEGDVIGYVGSTGDSKGCHLHIESSQGRLVLSGNEIVPEMNPSDNGPAYTSIGPVKSVTRPTNPSIKVVTNGTNLTLTWSADNANTYTLYFAPYPTGTPVNFVDMGTLSNILIDLWSGAAYYVAITASNIFGTSEPSHIEHFDLTSPNNNSSGNCGAYIAPGVWKEFDCYNLAAIGKTTNDDPFTPSWRLNGGYWQWGRKGPDQTKNDWHKTSTEHFAPGPTGDGSAVEDVNAGSILFWDTSYASDGAWKDDEKSANDPCPAGYRVPTKTQWEAFDNNNTQSTVGTWSSSATNYTSARFFGDNLMLPAAGRRDYDSGALSNRGSSGYYWSSSESSGYRSRHLAFDSGRTRATYYAARRSGFSVRCVAE